MRRFAGGHPKGMSVSIPRVARASEKRVVGTEEVKEDKD